MMPSDNDGEWISTRRTRKPSQKSQESQSESQVTQQERQSCLQCKKTFKVTKNGTMRSHTPCNQNQNPYGILSAQEEDINRENEPDNNTVIVPSQPQTVTNSQKQIDQARQGYKGKQTGPKFRSTQVWAHT